MEQTETSQRLTTIREHLTRALSSGGRLHVDLFNAYDELRTVESAESHKLIAREQFLPRLLLSFLSDNHTHLFRRWAGILVARFCHKSTAVANLFSDLAKQHGVHPLAFGLGNLILEEGRHEDLRLISGLIIRSCVYHGVDHRVFWPGHKAPASFPIDDGSEWADKFYQFTHAFDEVDVESSKGYSLSSVGELPEFSSRDPPLLRLIEVPNGLAVVALHLDLSHVQFLDIPVSSLLASEKEAQQLKLHFEDKTPLTINAKIVRTRQLTIRFRFSGVAGAALRTVEDSSNHWKIAKAARLPQRFSTTEAIDLSFIPSPPDYSSRQRQISTIETLDIDSLPKTPVHDLRAMSEASAALARRRAKRVPQNSGSSSSLDRSLNESTPATSATQPNPAKPPQVLVPESIPTEMAYADKRTTADDEAIVADSFPRSPGREAAASSANTGRNSQNAKTHGREAPKSGSRGAASQTQKITQENGKGTQTTGVKRPGEKSGDVRETGTSTRKAPVVDKKRKTNAEGSAKQKTHSKNDAFDSSHYDLPDDEEDGSAETSAPKPMPKKSGPAKPSMQPYSKGKAAATRSSNRPKASTQHLSQEATRRREHESSSSESDGPDDSSDEDFRGTSPRGRSSDRKGKRRSSRVRNFQANKEASRTRGPSKLRDQLSQPQSQEHVAEDGRDAPRLDDAESANKTRPQEKPSTERQVSDSDVYGSQSRPGSPERQSELLKPQPANDRSDEVQPAPLKDHRGQADMERQRDEIDLDDFLTDISSDDLDLLSTQTEQAKTVEAEPGADPKISEAAEGSEKTQEDLMGINADHEHLPPANEPAMEGSINPAALELDAVANKPVPAFEREGEQPETLEKDAIATDVVPALVQEERQAEKRTNQPDETSREAVGKPTSDRIWEPSSSYGKKTPGKSSPPDPRKSVFAKKTASGNSNQPHPSSSVSADRRRENIDVADDEREIEKVQETRHDGMEIVADNEMGIEKVPQAHDENAERPPLDERTNRKPRIIEFDRTGPVNQGKTPRGSKVLPQSHSFGATQTKTASHRMDQMSNKRTPVRLPRQYGSGPQRTYQEHVSYGEMLSSPDRSNPPEKKKSLGHSQTIEGPAVESAVEKTRRKTPSEGTAELESEDELSRSPPTKTRASVSPNGRDLQGVEVPAIEPGISIQPGSKPPSESDYEDDLADGSTFCPPSDNETSPGINHPVMETEIENDAQKTLSESGAEWGFAHESTVVPLAEIEQSAPSKSGPSPRHLDGKPASEVVSSPAQATPSSFVPTPAATNRTKRRHEEGVDDFSNLLAKSVSFSGHGKAQPAPHSVGASKELDTPEDPYKRRKFDHQPSNTHRESLKALPLFKKTEATAPPVPHFKQPIPLQRKNSTRISEDGSPEPYDDPKRSVFNVAGSSETRPQSHLNRSPAMARARIAPSPSYSRSVLSSNKKKVPDPPLASSNAITEHASEDMLEQSKILNTPAPPEANPFTSPETLKNGESKFAARLRRKTEAQGVKSADGKQGSKTIGLEALVKARLEDDDDPDKTLVNDDDMGDFPEDDSDMSNASTLDEDEDEDEDLHLKHRHPDEMDWEERLKPHQQNYASALSRVSQRLVRHLIDQETAIEDIVVAFQQDGNNLIDELERAHEEEFELERDTVIKAKTELQSMLERMSVKLRNDKQLYEARRQKLRQEAETSNRFSGLKKQIGVLEGMLKETK